MDRVARHLQVREAVPGRLAGVRRLRPGRRPVPRRPVPALRRGLRAVEGSAPQARRQAAAGPANLLANASFESGRKPWFFSFHEQHNLRRTYRRTSFALARLLANMGVAAPTPLLARFSSPVTAAKPENRWLDARLYLDQPEEWDDPYRFFRW